MPSAKGIAEYEAGPTARFVDVAEPHGNVMVVASSHQTRTPMGVGVDRRVAMGHTALLCVALGVSTVRMGMGETQTMTQSYLEKSFALWMRQEGIAGWEREYRFHPTRRWRFDFAFPAEKVAVEIDGLVWSGKGRHQTVQGYIRDAEKLEAALQLGWRVYVVPGPWVATSRRHIWRPEVVDTLRVLLA